MKWILAGLLMWSALFYVTASSVKRNNPPSRPQKVTLPAQDSSGIVRLHNTLTGDFVCSGFVVGKTTLFTAAHCIPSDMMLEVRASNGIRTGIIAWAVGGNAQADLAIMRGRLKRFSPVAYARSAQVVLNNIEGNDRKIVTCGYPYGGSLLCVPMRNRKMFAFQISGSGYLYPGMSGGPVFDEATNTVIALNSAVTENVILVAPLIEIYKACNVEPEP